MPIYWTPAPYLRPDSRLFAAARCNMRRHEASPTSLRASRNWRAAMASAFDPIRVGSNSLSNPPLSVTHYVVGPTVAYGRIRTQNHRVETIGGGDLFDG